MSRRSRGQNRGNGIELARRGAGRFSLNGDLTFATVNHALKSGAAMFRSEAAIRVDLAGVERTDSAGLALLLEWVRLCRARGKEIAFEHLPRQMLSIAKISGLEKLLPVEVEDGSQQSSDQPTIFNHG